MARRWVERFLGFLGPITDVHAMGQDVANVYPRAHGRKAGAVSADRALRFHWGNKSIDETIGGTALGGTWKELVDAVRDNKPADFNDAITDLKALVSFNWDADATEWRDATWNGFLDIIHP